MARPTKYVPEMCAAVLELGAQGMSRSQIAVAIEVSRRTLHNWIEQNPEFAEAMDDARDAAQAWWETIGQNAVQGRYDGFPASAFIFQMKNRFPAEYRDRHEHDVTGSMSVSATIDRPPRESREEWLKRREAELGASVVAPARPPG